MASTSAAATVRTAKRQLRKAMAQKLAVLAPEDVANQSIKVAEQVLSSKTYAQATSISVYVNMDVGEVATDSICRSILKDGKRLYVPLFASPTVPAGTSGPTVAAAPTTAKTVFASDMVMLRLRTLSEYEDMARNKWGIREPPLNYKDGTVREEALDAATGGQGLDLILAPGVAFDEAGGRLGHGKGYYDRYFARADQWAAGSGRQGPVAVALALRQQVLSEGQLVPSDEQDRVLDAILTPDACLRPLAESRWQ